MKSDRAIKQAFIQHVVDMTGLSPSRLATESGIAHTTLTRFMNKSEGSELKGSNLDAIARKGGYASYEDYVRRVLKEPKKVPVVGYVGAGAEVHTIDDRALGQGIEDAVDAPLGLEHVPMVAVRIRGESMLPLKDGWLLFYTRSCDGVLDECLNELCIVKIKDGPTYVKELKRGYQPGLFNLLSYNAAMIEDVEIEWAGKVIDIRPR